MKRAIALGTVMSFVGYRTCDTNFYRCSKPTHAFGFIMPLCVLLITLKHVDDDKAREQIAFLCSGMISFHFFYHMDGVKSLPKTVCN